MAGKSSTENAQILSLFSHAYLPINHIRCEKVRCSTVLKVKIHITNFNKFAGKCDWNCKNSRNIRVLRFFISCQFLVSSIENRIWEQPQRLNDVPWSMEIYNLAGEISYSLTKNSSIFFFLLPYQKVIHIPFYVQLHDKNVKTKNKRNLHYFRSLYSPRTTPQSSG